MLVTACSTKSISAKMASWQGSHIDEISSAWGSPDECFNRDGRQLCHWSESDLTHSSAAAPRTICLRTVEIDETGLITGWKWRGDRCADSASAVLARTSPIRPGIIAENDASETVELAVIEPAEQSAISRTQ